MPCPPAWCSYRTGGRGCISAWVHDDQHLLGAAGEEQSLLAVPAGPARQRDAIALADDSELGVGGRVARIRRCGRGRGGGHFEQRDGGIGVKTKSRAVKGGMRLR